MPIFARDRGLAAAPRLPFVITEAARAPLAHVAVAQIRAGKQALHEVRLDTSGGETVKRTCASPAAERGRRRAAQYVNAPGWRLGVLLVCGAVAFAAAPACGNGYGGPGTGPSPISPSTGAPGPIGATVMIASGAVSPQEVRIGVGQSVLFRNNDTRARDMTSDPHPTHTNCPSINAVGVLQPGQERATHGFGSVGTCGYHDHIDPDNVAVRGRIVVE